MSIEHILLLRESSAILGARFL